jgi:O-methyltransferase
MLLRRNRLAEYDYPEKAMSAWTNPEKYQNDAMSLPAPIGLRSPRAATSDQVTTPSSEAGELRRTWMKFKSSQRIVGGSKVLRRLTIGVFARLELLLLNGHKDRSTLKSIRRCRRDAESLLTGNEAFFLYSLAQAQCGLDGAMAELGVFQGSSARIICEAKKDCALYLFDTFAGLPEPGEIETGFLKPGQFAASLPAVKSLLKEYANVRFHPGIFPESAKGIDEVRFSLVHLDADLYSSTLAGLEFFYPRMVPGGIIMTHDYSTLPGVERAFAEFLREKPEIVIELPSTQAMIVVRGPTAIRNGLDARRQSSTV